MKTDVLVVGAGPVGLTLAAELARYGLRVRLVEKATQRTDKSKALVLWSRTLELMDRMGCTPSFLAAGFKASAANIAAGEKPITHIALAGVPSPYPFALMLPQSETERLLEEHLASLGVVPERAVEMLGFSSSASGITATLRHADGREETMETSWLVGCDGAHSTVRHQLGFEFKGDTLRSDWLLADVHLAGAPHPGEVNVMWHADGVLAIFPITENRCRLVADIGEAASGERPQPSLADVQAILDERGPGGITASDPVWLTAFRINERKVDAYRAGRVFLAGDAAHIHSPVGGQGMNTGMQDAFNLAWKLALTTRGLAAPEPLLESYSAERSAIGEMVVQGTSRLTTIATLRGGLQQAIRNHIATLIFGLSAVRHAVAETITEVSLGYPDSPLNSQGPKVHHGPHAGERAPIRHGDLPPGAGRTPRFTLCTEDATAAAPLLARFSALLEPEIRRAFQPGGLWLIRPDGYIAVSTRADDWDRVSHYLDALTNGTSIP